MKRRAHLSKIGFQRGNTPHNTGVKNEATVKEAQPATEYIRLPQDQYNMVSREKTDLVIDMEEKASPPMLLRPKRRRETMLDKAQVTSTINGEMDTYRLLHPKKTADLFNESFREHSNYNSECVGSLQFDVAGEMQWGIGWRERLKCDGCNYVSRRHNLYDEVPSTGRGVRAATCNYGLQVGLAHTSISNKGFAKILLSTNTPAPSPSNLQRSANKIGKVLVSTNEKSMTNICHELRQVNKYRGLPEETPIDLEIDARYNNPIYSGVGKTPFQAATQMTQVVAENSTPHKHIIAVTNKSKLCKICANNISKHSTRKKKKKSTKSVDGNAHDCTANISTSATIGDERQWTTCSLTNLEKKGIQPHHVVTDPDSKSYAGAEDVFFASSKAINPPKHQIDTQHVNRNLTKLVKKTVFSENMFPGDTQEIRSRRQNNFAIDLANRCHAEHKAAMKSNEGNTQKTLTCLYSTKSAIAQCYTGDHSLCKKHSYVCRGKLNNNWLSPPTSVLPPDFIIVPSKTDRSLLMKCIDYRLGPHVLPKLRYLLTTQKAEATNKAINNSAPRATTYTRNYVARVHTAVHSVNNGVGESITSACAASGAALTPGTRVTRKLLALQNTDKNSKRYAKSIKAITSRKMKKNRLFTLHRNLKEGEKQKKTYESAMCMPLHINEHSYSKKSTRR